LNFSLAELDQLLLDVTTPPVINQVQFPAFRSCGGGLVREFVG
jgi:hypothetical protein